MPQNTFENIGLTALVWSPTIVRGTSYDPTGYVIDGIARHVTSYWHKIEAIGGYWQAGMSLAGDRLWLEDWLDRVGYTVDVYQAAGLPIFRGFINKVSLSYGGLSVTRGPLLDVGNYVRVIYSVIDTSVDPPAFGRDITSWASNTDSQDRYGIMQTVVSADGRTDDTAEDQRDRFLAQYAWPQTSHEFTTEGGGTGSVSLEIYGFVHFLKQYVYNSTTTGTREISAKIQDILGADPNGLFSTDYTGIVTPSSTINVRRYDNDNRVAWALIKSLTSLGDGDQNRMLFGIYDDEKAYYDKIPDTDDASTLKTAITAKGPALSTLNNQIVDPWLARPGVWLQYTDVFTTIPYGTETARDPRWEFIESITYRAPYSLQHSGGKAGKYDQLMAQLGTGGLS